MTFRPQVRAALRRCVGAAPPSAPRSSGGRALSRGKGRPARPSRLRRLGTCVSRSLPHPRGSPDARANVRPFAASGALVVRLGCSSSLAIGYPCATLVIPSGRATTRCLATALKETPSGGCAPFPVDNRGAASLHGLAVLALARPRHHPGRQVSLPRCLRRPTPADPRATVRQPAP